jgi:hypothetical protein
MSLDNRGVVVHVACMLHNICIGDFDTRKPDIIHHGIVSDFSGESDHQTNDQIDLQHIDGTPVISQGYSCNCRGVWT